MPETKTGEAGARGTASAATARGKARCTERGTAVDLAGRHHGGHRSRSDLHAPPPDEGVVTPIARFDEEPDERISEQLDKVRAGLPVWQPGKVADPVQRVRNLLYIAAVPDVFQMSELEKFIPLVVYDQIQEEIPKEDS